MAQLNKTLRLFHRVAIIGVGLMGGSLAGAIKKYSLSSEVVGIDQAPSTLEKARGLGLIDQAFVRPEEGVEGADLVVLAVPVGSIVVLASRVVNFLREGTILTDLGSVKAPIVKEIEAFMPQEVFFIGGHPITGREGSGPEASSPDLFKGANCILTVTHKTDPLALQRLKVLWHGVGSLVVLMDPHRHDHIFAATSHLPHIVAYSLVNTLLNLEEGEGDLLSYGAGGLKDFTRIAASHPTLWRDICLHNSEEVLAMIARFKEALGKIEGMIATRDGEGLQAEFERARVVRSKI